MSILLTLAARVTFDSRWNFPAFSFLRAIDQIICFPRYQNLRVVTLTIPQMKKLFTQEKILFASQFIRVHCILIKSRRSLHEFNPLFSPSLLALLWKPLANPRFLSSKTNMAGAQFEYDEKGTTFYYFLISFFGIVLVPVTYYVWKITKLPGKYRNVLLVTTRQL